MAAGLTSQAAASLDAPRARCDGILPVAMDEDGFRDLTPEDVRDMLARLREHGGAGPGFDVVQEGETPTEDPSHWPE